MVPDTGTACEAGRFNAHFEKVIELGRGHGGTKPGAPTLATFAAALDELQLRLYGSPGR